MKHSFFGWYYTDGLRALFRITKDILRFIVRYFSLALLLRTFFAPWRRDVEIRDWHGLHPLRALHMFFDNFFARVMGMLMRTIVITSVIVMLVAGCVVAVVGLLFAFCTPLLLFFLLFLFFFFFFFFSKLFLWGVFFFFFPLPPPPRVFFPPPPGARPPPLPPKGTR